MAPVAADIEYHSDFPNGSEIIPTSGTNLLCGLQALCHSIQAQCPGIDAPDVDVLLHIVRCGQVADEYAAILNGQHDGDFIPVDQRAFNGSHLGGVLREWGQEHGWRVN
jgi:hypothetical protein